MSVLGHAAPDDAAVEDIEGGEQGGGAVPLVVVGHGAALARLQRQARLRAVEGLNLTLLVDRNDHGMRGRVHVQPDDVLDLGGESWVVGLLEGADAVWLKPVGLPDALHGAQADACGLGHHAAGPVGRSLGRLAAGQRQHLGDRCGRQRRTAGLACLVPQQALYALLGEALLPTPHSRSADAALPGDFENRQPVGREQDDPGPLDMLLRTIAIVEDCIEPHPIIGAKENVDALSHARKITQHANLVNPPFASLH